jgi:hypothetical protein
MNCDQETTFAMLACILVIAFFNVIDVNVPQLKILFTNDTNILLLCLLVILVVLVNIPVGIMLLVVVGYAKLYYSKKYQTISNKSFETFSDIKPNPPTGISHVDPDQNIIDYSAESKQHNANLHSMVNNKSNAVCAKEVPVVMQEKKFDKFNFPGNGFLTQQGHVDKAGYDISGCRYDMKAEEQNLTKYGPPVSFCGAYSEKSLKHCGTYYYPLNG